MLASRRGFIAHVVLNKISSNLLLYNTLIQMFFFDHEPFFALYKKEFSHVVKRSFRE